MCCKMAFGLKVLELEHSWIFAAFLQQFIIRLAFQSPFSLFKESLLNPALVAMYLLTNHYNIFFF